MLNSKCGTLERLLTRLNVIYRTAMQFTPMLTSGDASCKSGASLSISNTNASCAKPRTLKEEFKPAKRLISLGETGSGPGNRGSSWSGVTSREFGEGSIARALWVSLLRIRQDYPLVA